jgi:hypothetical protein
MARGGNRQTQPFSDADLRALMWAQVEREGECWVWTGFCAPSGYGSVTRHGKSHRVHRLAWEDAYGPIPPDLIVMHLCDNRRCLRLTHLALGTCADNDRDRVSKGRQVRGERVNGSRLSRNDVVDIRRRYPETSLKVLAREFSVNPTSIHRAATGRTWGWLNA